jgi:hypothetical protein
VRRVAVVVSSALAACALVTNLGDLGGGAQDAAGDGGNEATLGDGGDPSIVIAQVGGIATATGNVQQQHLVWAQVSKQYVLFYITDADTTHLRTRITSDFTQWKDGPALALPYTHGNDGRELSVAYANLANVDVVHVAMSHEISNGNRRHTHTRAVVAPGTITFGTPEDVTQTSVAPTTAVDPDAPATIVTTAGVVMDATGWAAIADAGGSAFNSNVFVANGVDVGTSFASNGWTQMDLEVDKRHVNSRELFEANGTVRLFWDSADTKPNPTDVRMSTFKNNVWSAPISVFGEAIDAGESEDDWCATQLGGALPFDAIRQTASLGLEHASGSSTFSPSFGLPPIQRAPGSGLACVVTGGKTVATIALDGTVAVTHAANGAFDPWSTIVPTQRARAYLTLTPGGNNQVAILWTQVGAAGYEIAGVLGN